jgi:hypothetical protein
LSRPKPGKHAQLPKDLEGKLHAQWEAAQDGGTEKHCKQCGEPFVALGLQNFCGPICRRKASDETRKASFEEWKRAKG